MVSVANSALRHLSDQVLCEPQKHFLHGSALVKAVQHHAQIDSDGRPCFQDDSAVVSLAGTHQQIDADHALSADDGHVAGRAIFKNMNP